MCIPELHLGGGEMARVIKVLKASQESQWRTVRWSGLLIAIIVANYTGHVNMLITRGEGNDNLVKRAPLSLLSGSSWLFPLILRLNMFVPKFCQVWPRLWWRNWMYDSGMSLLLSILIVDVFDFINHLMTFLYSSSLVLSVPPNSSCISINHMLRSIFCLTLVLDPTSVSHLPGLFFILHVLLSAPFLSTTLPSSLLLTPWAPCSKFLWVYP